MINNFANTEKSLKRWLKTKVSVTMATVVGFLIAGTVTMGAMVEIPEKTDITIKAGQVSDVQGKYQVTVGDEVKAQGEATFYGTKSTYEDLLGENLKGSAEDGWIVNKNIVIDGSEVKKGPIAPAVISAGDSSAKKMINKGNIWVKAGSGYVEAMGTQGSEATIINEGNIYVLDGTQTKAKGMGVNPGGTAINKGTIVVNSGSGMSDNSGSAKKTMINDVDGKIIVEGTGTGINYRKEAITDGSVENKGTIEVTGKGTGVLIANDKYTDDTYNGKSFTNSGKILANNGGKAIYSTSKDFILNLVKGSHIEGLIKLAGTNNTVNIDDVGTAESPEINNIESKDINVKINNSNIILEGSLKNTDGTVVELKAENGTITNKAEIVGNIGVSTQDWTLYNISAAEKFTNEGIINGKEFGIYSNAQIGTYIENIINNKEIKVNGENSYGIYAAGLAQTGANAKTYVENSGTINAEGKNAIGLRIHENASALNKNKIGVIGEESKAVVITGGANEGILDELKSEYIIFKNEGNLSTNGKNSIGLLLNHQAAQYLNEFNTGTQDVNISAINETNGQIIVTGEGAIGVKLTSAERKGLNSKDVKVNFTNDGRIELKDVTNGVGILVEAGEANNKGTIALEMNGTENKAINNIGGIAKNTGIIKITDMNKDEIISAGNKEETLDDLFDGEVEHLGLIVDKDGNALFLDENTTITEDTTTEVLDGIAQGNGTVGVDGDLTITGMGDKKVKSETFNVTGGVATIDGEVILDSDVINLDKDGQFAVGNGSTLTLENGTLVKAEENEAIKVTDGGTLVLNDMDINGSIKGEGNATVEVGGTNNLDGNFTGLTFDFTKNSNRSLSIPEKINIANFTVDSVLNNSKFNLKGNTAAQVALDTKLNDKSELENAFGNSTGIEMTGNSENENLGDLLVKTGDLSGDVTINLGDNTFTNVGVITDSEIYLVDKILNDKADGEETVIKAEYNNDLYANISELNEVNKAAKVVNNLFSQEKGERLGQLDKIYSTNIYSETVKAAYNNAKLNEETILSLARTSEVGKWTAEGKAIYDKSECDRDGITKDYSSEVESTGLMGALSYGVDETTTAGVAFSGVKQDVDTDGGSADADLFYLGVYGNKVYGNYDFTAGLGYQFGKYEADNTIANLSASDKYDSKAISGYVQGRYTADLGDGLSVQPKAKLGYTYVDQDDAKDAYFGISDAKVSTFDVEVGADLVKTVALEKGKMNLLAGVSYTRAMGDTDDKFDGRFYGEKASDKFDVLGAEIAENTVKFNVGAEVEHDNGLFYNGGMTYEVGSDDTKAYGVNVGAGYRF